MMLSLHVYPHCGAYEVSISCTPSERSTGLGETPCGSRRLVQVPEAGDQVIEALDAALVALWDLGRDLLLDGEALTAATLEHSAVPQWVHVRA